MLGFQKPEFPKARIKISLAHTNLGLVFKLSGQFDFFNSVSDKSFKQKT